ncbi:MAG: hypothetical protein HON04_00865 [Planctomicrobium sp.]|jgi:hypothetical protein|nr:hypothetical protein [Planctomicrobium sp.]
MNRFASISFYLLQIIFVGTIFGYGTVRYQARFAETALPTPLNEPVQMRPRYDRPDLLSDAQLVATLEKLKPRLRGRNPKINFVDHALRFWGVEAQFTDEQCLSGVEMRDLLLDHRVFQDSWGTDANPFLIPDFRGDSKLLEMRTKDGAASASHTDHSLASLAEVGTPLDFPVMTPKGEIELRAALEYSLREFSLNQDEYEWSTIIFLHYLPEIQNWKATSGQRITWDHLADRLMRQRLADGVCFGNHRLFALVSMLNADDNHQILSAEKRTDVMSYLKDVTNRLVKTQSAEGFWDSKWPGDERDGPPSEDKGSPLGDVADRILATGHALEWWAFAPKELLPPDETLSKAVQWTYSEIQALSDSQVKRFYTFLTHAGRALSLWRGKMPHEVWKERTEQLAKLNLTDADSDQPDNKQFEVSVMGEVR